MKRQQKCETDNHYYVRSREIDEIEPTRIFYVREFFPDGAEILHGQYPPDIMETKTEALRMCRWLKKRNNTRCKIETEILE